MKTPAFVAEISGNHLGKSARAAALVDMAAASGADAVKFQTYDPETLVGNLRLKLEDGPWKGRRLVDLYREAWTPRKWQPDLFQQAKALGMVAFSSPFSPEDVDFLESINCPIYKIASFELTDLGLVRYAAETRKPIVLSTGMATLVEIEEAVEEALGAGAKSVTVLKCTSGYPTPLAEANLATLGDLRDYFKAESRVRFGLSDHTIGITAAVTAIALGAVMVEKHLTVSKADGGPDAAFSAEPMEFKALVDAGRLVAEALGSVHYGPTASEAPQLCLRRGLWVVDDVKEGQPFTRENLRSARPITGVRAALLPTFLGKRAARAVKAGTPFEESMVRSTILSGGMLP